MKFRSTFGGDRIEQAKTLRMPGVRGKLQYRSEDTRLTVMQPTEQPIEIVLALKISL